MDFKKMELSELASLVKVSLKEPGIGMLTTNLCYYREPLNEIPP